MIIFRARILTSSARRTQVIRSLRRILDSTRTLPGCTGCQLCTDVENENLLVLTEEWADSQNLKEHLRSDDFRVVLSALDCASDPPQVRIDTVADTKGMGFIMVCRGCEGSEY